MSLRGQLKSVKILLAESREVTGPMTAANALGIAERVQELNSRIEQQPQLSAVRPATIALHNLIMSLRRPNLSADLDEELNSAIEMLEELLADDTFGLAHDELRDQIAAALKSRGVHACIACKHTGLTIEPVYALMKPFPSDAELAPTQLPCASIVCDRCGLIWMHDLVVLGVL